MMSAEHLEQPAVPVRPIRDVTPFTSLSRLVWIWLGLRVATIAFATFVSPLRPLTEVERAIAVWPPVFPLGEWLHRVLLAPLQRWDTKYYMMIVEQGYRTDNGTAQFHPLFPWLASPIAWLTGNSLFALTFVSSVSGLMVLLAFERLAQLDLSPIAARTSTLLFLCTPFAFALFVPYTESLWLLCAVLCLYWSRQRRWWLAGVAGCFATLTRQQGLFLAVPLAWELWEANGRDWRRIRTEWRSWVAIGFVPGGLLIWLVYRAMALGDVQADLNNPQSLIYSLLISPSSAKVVPVQAFLLPPHALWLALRKLWYESELSLVVDLVLGAIFILMLVSSWQSMRVSYRIYSVLIVLVSFGYYTGPVYPYMGLPRHLLLAFPVFIGLADGVRRPLRYALTLMFGLMGMFFLLLLYTLEAWTP